MKARSKHPLIAYQHNKLSTVHSNRITSGFLKPFRRVPRKALIDFTRSFALMIRARLSLLQALDTAVGQCQHKNFKAVLGNIKKQVEGGKGLAASFDLYQEIFDPLYINLTRVGEAAGILDQVLLRIAKHQEKSEALRRKIMQAMAYPIVVLTVAIAATIFLLTSIVPTFADMFEDFGATLPAPTRIILKLSGFLVHHAPLITAGLVGLVGLFAWLGRRPDVLLMLDKARLNMPLVASLLRKNLVAKFCRTLGTLLENDVPLIEALEIVGEATGNRVLDQKILKATRVVCQGRSLHQQLENTGIFPAFAVHMIMVGEETAELDLLLLQVAAYYEMEVEIALDTLSSILEPILIVLIGVILGGILVALYLPMFDLVNVVG